MKILDDILFFKTKLILRWNFYKSHNIISSFPPDEISREMFVPTPGINESALGIVYTHNIHILRFIYFHG